jgi:hypothetical protein
VVERQFTERSSRTNVRIAAATNGSSWSDPAARPISDPTGNRYVYARARTYRRRATGLRLDGSLRGPLSSTSLRWPVRKNVGFTLRLDSVKQYIRRIDSFIVAAQQHPLQRAQWDADGACDVLRRYVIERQGERDGVLTLDSQGTPGQLRNGFQRFLASEGAGGIRFIGPGLDPSVGYLAMRFAVLRRPLGHAIDTTDLQLGIELERQPTNAPTEIVTQRINGAR